MATKQSRRSFLAALSSAGATGLIGASTSLAQEAPPETTRIRLVQVPSICQAAQFLAEELLRREGFADVQYIKKPGPKGIDTALASGEADINMHFNARLIMRVDAGDPVVILAGGHPGCFELFGTDRVRAIRDLKGKTVGVRAGRRTARLYRHNGSACGPRPAQGRQLGRAISRRVDAAAGRRQD